MKIFNSSVQLFSQHTAIVQHEVKESLQLWIGHRRPAVEGQGSPLSERWSGATLHFSQAARGAQPSKQIAPADAEVDLEDEPKLTLIIRMVEIITGKKIKLISPKELKIATRRSARASPANNGSVIKPTAAGRSSSGSSAICRIWHRIRCL